MRMKYRSAKKLLSWHFDCDFETFSTFITVYFYKSEVNLCETDFCWQEKSGTVEIKQVKCVSNIWLIQYFKFKFNFALGANKKLTQNLHLLQAWDTAKCPGRELLLSFLLPCNNFTMYKCPWIHIAFKQSRLLMLLIIWFDRQSATINHQSLGWDW